MTLKIAINGFGRIGRAVFRIIAERNDMEVVAVNDLFENEVLAYLLKHDTVHHLFSRDVSWDKDMMYVDGSPVKMIAERNPAALPWKELGVDIVVESTGVFRDRSALESHLNAGADKVVLTVPPKDSLDAMVVMGVNEEILHSDVRLVSNASCTTNCLAPMAKVLNDNFGLNSGLISTVHAYTNDQRLADVPHADFRRSRAAAENIIPTTTGAARAVGKILPELAGRLDGMALRVPVPDGSVVDLVACLERDPSPEEINAAFKTAADGPLKGIIDYCTSPVVSSDIVGNPHSCVYDTAFTETLGDGFVHVLAWYDNEWGYSNRVVDLIDRLSSLG